MANKYAVYNAQQRVRLHQQLHAAVQIGDKAAPKAITAIGYDLEGKIKLSLKGPGKGRVYKKYNPSRVHVASAPGDPPASDTGRLMGSISITHADDATLAGKLRGIYAVGVGTHVKYAPFLEFGTRPRSFGGSRNAGIRPRPYFRRAAAAMAKSIPDIVKIFMAQEAAKLARGELGPR